MGKLIYGAPTWSVEFEDRALAHLRIVIIAKLRRSESFTFSWKFEAAYGSGRSSLLKLVTAFIFHSRAADLAEVGTASRWVFSFSCNRMQHRYAAECQPAVTLLAGTVE